MRGRAAILAAVAALAAPRAHGGDAPDWGRRIADAGYDLVGAIQRGLKDVGEGTVFHVELERDEGKVVYSVDVAKGKKVHNVVLDPRDGRVIRREVDDEDRSALVASAKTTLVAAIEAAEKAAPGDAVEAILRAGDGSAPVVHVTVLAERKAEVVRVDGATGAVLAEAAAAETPYADAFVVEPSEWASRGTNPWFVLEPGRVLVLEGEEDGEKVRVTVTVLDETRKVAGVETRVVEEREEEGGEVVEVSRNFFAISTRTNDVHYFGEEVDLYEGGKVVGHAGAWLAGEKGARFGLAMPGTPLPGARYHQEVAPGVAMDRAEVVSTTATVETPAGRFEGCLETLESTPLEPGRERKAYARGIGLVLDAGLRLVRHGGAK